MGSVKCHPNVEDGTSGLDARHALITNAWTFGATYIAANGSAANMKLGTRDYLIQQTWVNSSAGFCALKF
jgi:hypothetical protein